MLRPFFHARVPTHRSGWALVWTVTVFAGTAMASGLDEFKVNREGPFEFARKPVVTREGDRVTVEFETKAFCDVTVAIEEAVEKGTGTSASRRSQSPFPRIVRHLASGVLGPNAPAPFQKNSKKQSVVWDGKNDQGVYLDEKDQLTVRVSLGLKPRFERPLLWSPYKRYGSMPVLAAAPEGVYVADGKGVEFIRLYDHEGRYVRTVYPFPREKLEEVKGLNWYDFPQGYRLPRKGGLYQHSLLTAGANVNSGNHSVSRHAPGATAIAVRDNRLATVYMKLCRLGTDGASAGLEINGPDTGHTVKSVAGGMDVNVGPASMAFSPDGKTVYLTGYLWRTGSWRRVPGCLHAVYKIDYEKGTERTVFMGEAQKHGTDNRHFQVPTSVACDAQGRVYVSDFIGNRIQVYEADGTHVKTIPTTRPAQVCIDRRTGEIWAFSYEVIGVPFDLSKQYRYAAKVDHAVTRFSALPEAKQLSREAFPFGPGESMGFEAMGHVYRAALDPWAKEPTVWVVGRTHQARGAEFHFSGGYAKADRDLRRWEAGVRLLRKRDGAWKTVRAFGNQTVREVARAAPPRHNIQRLIVNPLTGMLYVGEPDSAPTIKASKVWLQINPDTGRIRLMDLPFNAMEGAFDLDGHLYLRNTDMIVRYDFATMREVPWDYGLERERQGNDGGIYGKSTYVKAGLKMPSTSPVCYHQGGFSVSPTGDVIASCAYRYVGISSGHKAGEKFQESYAYKPVLFPGRIVSSTSPCIHVWDKTGRIKYEDAVPGIGQVDGVAIDRDDNIYVMHTPSRAIDGKRYFNEMSETLMKVRPNSGRILSGTKRARVPLPEGMRPKRDPDMIGKGGRTWAESADWFYGGVGFAGFNMIGHGGGCACWFARFTLDYFARSIAPEPHQYRVAVLDSAGNLILRIGTYGNEQDGVPLVQPEHFRRGAGHVSELPAEGALGKGSGDRSEGSPEPLRRDSLPRSIGGDEVALFHACFVGTHTDHRIFIADYGNNRIVSVKLDYHATERVGLGDVPDTAR